MRSVVDKRCTFFIQRHAATTARDLEAKGYHGFANPQERKNGEDQRGPVDEPVGGLVGENGPEVPCDGSSGGEITLGRAERVRGSRGFEEEESEEDEDFGPNASMVRKRVDTKGSESREDDEDGGPAVIQGEWEMDEEFVRNVGGLMMLLDDVIDVRHRGGNEQSEEERWMVAKVSI